MFELIKSFFSLLRACKRWKNNVCGFELIEKNKDNWGMNTLERELTLEFIFACPEMSHFAYGLSSYKRRVEIIYYMLKKGLKGRKAYDYIMSECQGSTLIFANKITMLIDKGNAKKFLKTSDLRA